MMHLKNHAEELRQGIEAGLSNIDTRSENGVEQHRQVTIPYHEGTIRPSTESKLVWVMHTPGPETEPKGCSKYEHPL